MEQTDHKNNIILPSRIKREVSLRENNWYNPDMTNAFFPDNFDWRTSGKVSPVKDQGDCSSCWAFATVATVESAYAIKYNKSINLSEQQLVDCLHSQCEAGDIEKSFHYVMHKGLVNQTMYPYLERAGHCHNRLSRNWSHTHVKNYYKLGEIATGKPASDMQIMCAIINKGPVAVLFDYSGLDFLHYKSGILTTGVKQWFYVHAAILVGWGTENGHDYWIMKNSWGPDWGEAGYVRLARGKNLRGINDMVHFPVI